MRQEEIFSNSVSKRIADLSFRMRLSDSYDSLDLRRKRAVRLYQNLELARQRAAYAKWKVNENLDKFLIDFEASVIRKGGKVIWASDANLACSEIYQLVQRAGYKSAPSLYSSPILAEIGLHAFLKSKNSNPVLSSIADYILQEQNLPHFSTQIPSANATFSDTKKRLNHSIRHTLDADSAEMVSDIRNEIRPQLLKSELAITGAQFLIADSGQVTLVDNSGGGLLNLAFIKSHIVVAGIDQLIPSINELELFLSLHATHSKGQSAYRFTTITGPGERDDLDGPAEFYVVLVDNGRSNVLAASDQRQALACIDCGACNSVCPVYRLAGSDDGFLGNQAGPIGLVVQPLKAGFEKQGFLSDHSTFCGRCSSVCPVNIDIHNQIIRNRRDQVSQGLIGAGDKLAWFSWVKLMMNRKNMNRQTTVRNFSFRALFKKDFGERRELPKIADKTFNEWWREKNGIK